MIIVRKNNPFFIVYGQRDLRNGFQEKPMPSSSYNAYLDNFLFVLPNANIIVSLGDYFDGCPRNALALFLSFFAFYRVRRRFWTCTSEMHDFLTRRLVHEHSKDLFFKKKKLFQDASLVNNIAKGVKRTIN